MDLTYLHLLISHLPVFGCFLGICILIYGMLSKSRTTIQAAYLVFILSSIGGVIAYLTGEAAEGIVNHILGITQSNIEAHVNSAQLTIIALIILGLVACIALIFKKRLKRYNDNLILLILCIALFCACLAARTAYLGGKIRHSEIEDSRGLLGAK